MTAFERVKSGIPEMDAALDSIRLGDNVVLRVSDLREFHLFLDPFVRQAIADHRNLIYIRFAAHEPLLQPQEGVKIVNVELSHRFETFTVAIHNLIREEGRGAFYVFDCLSELQTAWATDLMMGNFFRVTCPYLFSLDTVAVFPLIRGMHSFQTIAKIRDTTQLFLDIYSDTDTVFVRPGKVWNRYSDSMFLPHEFNPADGTFRPVFDGVKASRFYRAMNNKEGENAEQNLDFWDRFFNLTRQKYLLGMDVTEECSRMCNIMMSRDEHMRKMIKKHFTPEDYFSVRSRMIGTGMIGGKSCGMLLARKIIRDRDPELWQRLEPHDSFYIGSDVFYTYIVENGYWDMRVRQREEENYFTLAKPFADRLMHGRFPRELTEQFTRLLEYYGQDPVIVRSSSILEDGFGNAFAGKYDSVFCSNCGNMEERLEEFENAIRIVYASTMSLSALDYRKRRGLEKRDEQMSILVQRVSGSFYGNYYMPCAAGVGYSFAPYRFLESMDQNAGMLRLVMGLGVSAVDRTEGSYPRLVNLDQPLATPSSGSSERHRYSQRKIFVVNREKRCLEQIELDDIIHDLPSYLKRILLEHDYDAERMFRERGENRDILFISCAGLVHREDLMADARRILHLLQDEYRYPVDTEFTVNISETGEYVINLLQCRPLQVSKSDENTQNIRVPAHPDPSEILLETRGASMGFSRILKLDLIVMVDAEGYYRLPYADKPAVSQVIRSVCWKYRDQGKNMMLIVPGRVGTTSPELGVPTTFADISEFNEICETSSSGVGYQPELSYGSHFFQDLVESEIGYTAVFENEKTLAFHPEKLKQCPNLFVPDPELKIPEGVIYICDVSGLNCTLYRELADEHTLVTIHI